MYNDLHSIMYLLIQVTLKVKLRYDEDLHSIMYLLILLYS